MSGASLCLWQNSYVFKTQFKNITSLHLYKSRHILQLLQWFGFPQAIESTCTIKIHYLHVDPTELSNLLDVPLIQITVTDWSYSLNARFCETNGGCYAEKIWRGLHYHYYHLYPKWKGTKTMLEMEMLDWRHFWAQHQNISPICGPRVPISQCSGEGKGHAFVTAL